LGILQFNPKHPAVPMYKLLKSAINNWEQKNTDEKVEDAGLVVKTIMVDCGRVIKRMRPAPQGRGYRVRKRSNHVTIVVDSIHNNEPKVSKKKAEKVETAPVAEPVGVPKAKKAAPKKAAPKTETKAKAKPAGEKAEKKKTEKNSTK
jgi:large subunit ribosomal protein L22